MLATLPRLALDAGRWPGSVSGQVVAVRVCTAHLMLAAAKPSVYDIDIILCPTHSLSDAWNVQVLAFLSLFFKDYFYFGKADLQNYGETEKKIFHLLIHSPNGHSGQS